MNINELTTVLNPVWGNEEKTVILCELVHPKFESPLHCVVSNRTPGGSTEQVFNRVVAGEFGSIGDYVPPTPDADLDTVG